MRILKIFLPLFTLLCLYNFISFSEEYFIVSPYKSAKAMLYGNMEISYWLTENTKDMDKVYVSRSLSEPHIYIAFAEKTDPIQYQKNSQDWSTYKEENLSFLDQLGTYELGKYVFTSIEYKSFENQKNIILVGKPNEFPENARVIAKFLYPDGSPAVVAVEPFSEAYALNLND